MTREEREHRDQQITDFRYQLVAELANPYLSGAERRELIRQKAAVEHEVPLLGRRRYTASCIHKWLLLYRKHGRAGLAPRARRDAGRSRAMSDTEAAVLLLYLENHPELTAAAALRTLQADGRISSHPSTSALSRLVRSAGLQRRERQRQLHGAEQKLKFDFFAPLECVQVDCMHALKLPDPNGRRRMAILLAFLDDATRRILYACWAWRESAVAFEIGIRHILAAHGRIGRLYCDNGSPFVSTQTRRILDSLGLTISHSRVGKPAGRGKIERFFRTVRQQFLAPLDVEELAGIADLDQRFHTWLESEYHRSPHRGLDGATPLATWLTRSHLIVPLDPTIDLQQAFRHEALRTVHRDGTITLDSVLFELPATLIGQRVTLRYDPQPPPRHRRLVVYHDGRCLGEARRVDSYANAHVRRGPFRLELADQDNDDPDEDQQDPGSAGAAAKVPPAPPGPTTASLAASRVELPTDEHPQEHRS